jgi:hypothetical protein
MYSVPAFLISWFIANLPLQVFSCVIFSAVFYPLVGLRGSSVSDAMYHYGVYLSIMVAEQLVTISFSFASISVFRDFAPSSLLANTLYTFYSVSAGFFIPSTM